MAASARSFLRPLLQPLWPTFREIFVLSVFVNLLALAVPVFVMQVYDRVVFHAGLETLQGLCIGVAVVLAFDWVLRQSRARILQRVALRVDVAVGRTLFEKIVSLPLAVLESRPTAQWHALFRDVDTIRGTLSGGSALMVCDVPFALFFLALTFYIAPPVAWVLLIALPVFTGLAWWSARTMIASGQEERDSTLARDLLLSEVINGRTTVKALALDQAIRPLWELRHADSIGRAVTRGARADGFTNLGSTLTMLGTVAMTTVGAVAIIRHEMSIGALIAANMLSGRLLGVLGQLVTNWRGYAAFGQSVRRLSEVLAWESERQTGGLQLDPPRGDVTLEAVRFAYAPGDRPTIDDVSLRIGPGGVYGLVGANGSGKSTLLKLMQGLYRPVVGRVLLDGADITQFSRSQMASWIGYVPQDCVLFAGSIGANIAHRVPAASDTQVERAARQAGVHQAIVDLPAGYATDVGEAGRRLSVGQRQRIAVARALVGDPPVLLLDEPTSSLDVEAGVQLRSALREIARTRTVVVATHSVQMLQVCRTIIKLERGRVVFMQSAEDALPGIIGAARTVPSAVWRPSPPVEEAAE